MSREDRGPVLAVDLGGTRVRTAVVDSSLAVRGRQEESTVLGFAQVMDQIARMARLSAAEAGVPWEEIRRIGVATPGPLDIRQRLVLSPPNMPGWGDVLLGDELEKRLDVPVALVNDANAGALGEWAAGAGRGTRDMVYITVSTGIGGGVISNGRLVEGAIGAAGEIGHMTIDRHGERCLCGNIGCLEMIASGTSIGRRFGQALASGRHSPAVEWLCGRKPTGADVARAVAMGDPLAREIFNDAAEALGTGVVNAIHLFNPEVIAIGGGVTKAGDMLFVPVRRMVEQYAFRAPARAARIVPAALGEDVGLIGAAVLALQS